MPSEDAPGDARSEPAHALAPGAPPAARFAVRALSAGASAARVATLLKTDAAGLAKQLRTAARLGGCPAPAPQADETALRTALAPLLAAERDTRSERRPTTRCPQRDVLDALSAGRLDGPLLLAQLDHLADCRACLAHVLDERAGEAAGAAPSKQPEPPADRRGCAGVVLSGLLLAAAALFRAAL